MLSLYFRYSWTSQTTTHENSVKNIDFHFFIAEVRHTYLPGRVRLWSNVLNVMFQLDVLSQLKLFGVDFEIFQNFRRLQKRLFCGRVWEVRETHNFFRSIGHQALVHPRKKLKAMLVFANVIGVNPSATDFVVFLERHDITPKVQSVFHCT